MNLFEKLDDLYPFRFVRKGDEIAVGENKNTGHRTLAIRLNILGDPRLPRDISDIDMGWVARSIEVGNAVEVRGGSGTYKITVREDDGFESRRRETIGVFSRRYPEDVIVRGSDN